MTTQDIARWFQLRRACSALDAVRRAEAVVIRRSFRPDRPRGQERAQLMLPFEGLKSHKHLP